ncbi:MAG: succinylglutamate-semialdehyde dehydrogenase [Ketobacter sp.]|nr:MAG: succinylglutamate-semialdehyde dehydrogenase [Ketobacter sp.]
MDNAVFIDQQWSQGHGPEWASMDPVDEQVVWQGRAAAKEQVSEAVMAARSAYTGWSRLALEQRLDYINRFVSLLQQQSERLAQLISREGGKALWDARTEVAAMIGKAAISQRAYQERTGFHSKNTVQGELLIRHKPHGVLAVFGPFNFPGHLPNGHIIPALLAGNTVVFKPSELTPAVACAMVELWHTAGLPAGVLNLVCGDKITGSALVEHEQVDGILFTGSAQTGRYLHQQYAGQPHKVLALEMGGNNPLLVEPVQDMRAALFVTLFSAFVSSGQRCTCARRVLLPRNDWGDAFLAKLVSASDQLAVARGSSDPQPFMGAVISPDAVKHLQHGIQLLQNVGGDVLLQARYLNDSGTLMTPTLIDMSQAQQNIDDELFGPVLQIFRYQELDEAIAQANDTRFGLAAGIITDDQCHYDHFYQAIRAGIVNCNKPLTGASSEAPFGGIGASGNHQPSAYYAADYCAYPVATLRDDKVVLPTQLPPGIEHALA